MNRRDAIPPRSPCCTLCGQPGHDESAHSSAERAGLVWARVLLARVRVEILATDLGEPLPDVMAVASDHLLAYWIGETRRLLSAGRAS